MSVKKVAVVYTHFPHYRQAVFDAMNGCEHYEFDFFYDQSGIDGSIASGHAGCERRSLPVFRIGRVMWQAGVISTTFDRKYDAFILLGNPLILSYWLAAVIARCRGAPILFWTHGWLCEESGLKALVRRFFYSLGSGLLTYGSRAKMLGEKQGYPTERIHVIGNSLDYALQKSAREAVLAGTAPSSGIHLPDKPFFLSVGRLIPALELGLAFEAMTLMPVDTALLVVGVGSEQKDLEEKAHELNLDVQFLGEIYDEEKLARLFLNACAVVAPGKVGLVVMHAFAYGAPVITHDNLDMQFPEVEAIQQPYTGSFFKQGNALDLSRVMSVYLKDREQNESIHVCRKMAIEQIEANWTPEVQLTRIVAVLDQQFK